MTVTTYDDIAEYAARALPLLEHDEARHNLAIGVIRSMQAGRLVPHGTPLLAVVSADGGDDAVALHTPPWGLLLTGLPAGAERELVDAVLAGGWSPRFLVGPPAAVDPVSAEWCGRTGATVRWAQRQGVYALRDLVPPAPARGEPRFASGDDADVVAGWISDFQSELGIAVALPRAQVDERVAAGDIALWCVDGVPVSMAGIGARTATGARIGPVYTPPEHRRRGYAAAATAVATRRALDGGAQQCFLYTDLDNPTSNAIYQRLGYRLVCESREVTFA